ncbi:transketolase [Polynucleobacter sp. IMCC30063]|uniref:transketolase n=1 Tax=Polynucleobacter sp. IMCC30063 TaxID=2907298 RepID=UPI001F295DB2|nr:transketolase [Polynucleobacter sp. IMCC30063]MCE7505289.1 transketolase [Polynucleobacter sp. IMCC30063]
MDDRSRYLRSLIVRALEGGGRGHIGSSMSLVEVLRVLFDSHLKINPSNPSWPDRDRFILSKGHGCLALYALLADKGYFELSELDTFCAFDSILGGHPDLHKVPGVEASTGALGHGLSIGVGMAIAARLAKMNNRVYVILGDGEINEGSVWEAALSASKHQLTNLTILVDYNKLQSYGPTSEVLNLEPLVDKWRAFGFSVREVDGHNIKNLNEIFSQLPFEDSKPNAIICHTIKGKGISFAEGVAEWHHKSGLNKTDIESLYKELS